ncbi:DUF4956 domain-containing protein [Candidatus Enterococcus clewellii]|uniref:DUF4956 domain-containing protein n=1 Tax=Candidatus Enterococcus clewellii TaxID=1834193 RepID=A0A242KBY8_9ENTE|nr:DUF4956 domain-containing protein [Enterococcus sp. 9E7_DIV0242]OTP18683.1 hypothetical protein A5888_000497 [Enterococcus sp. 9E7_DIV0242]
MLSSLFTESSVELDLMSLFLCILTSLALGLLVACVHMYRSTYSKNFIITLVILPILVQLVIMLVNGNLGTGVAIMGAFSLIRFRSVAGGAREITSVFWSMGIGLATGMGFISYVILFSLVIALTLILLNASHFGEKNKVAEREIKITIPEDLDYPDLFDDLFKEFTYNHNLDSVKTTNMGSLYELRYHVTLKDAQKEKALMDALRVRNGNLTIVSGKVSTNKDEL